MDNTRITADMFLPEIVERFPATRLVLDRYGLHGCGGPKGPREQVSWFARLHGVPLDPLLRELNDAARRSTSRPALFRPSLPDTIYRPFFIAGITTVLTLGCMWGAINLLTNWAAKKFFRSQLLLGARACARNGVWVCRLLHYGICLSGVSAIQTHKPVEA
jgi:hypothetical protein